MGGFIAQHTSNIITKVARNGRFMDLNDVILNSNMEPASTMIAMDPPQTTFEPMLPDTSAYASIGIVAVLCVVCWLVWNNEVVPISRQKLAVSKRGGGVREYLDELSSEETDKDERKLEKWLFADWLNPNKKKEAAVPFLKKAKWNSGDNPVLVASALIGFAVIFASITERVAFMSN